MLLNSKNTFQNCSKTPTQIMPTALTKLTVCVLFKGLTMFIILFQSSYVWLAEGVSVVFQDKRFVHELLAVKKMNKYSIHFALLWSSYENYISPCFHQFIFAAEIALDLCGCQKSLDSSIICYTDSYTKTRRYFVHSSASMLQETLQVNSINWMLLTNAVKTGLFLTKFNTRSQ